MMKGVAPMTGSLQIKNNRFHMVISYVDKDGKRKNRWISTKLTVKGNKTKAQAMLNQYLREHNGCDMDLANQLLADYMDHWMDNQEAKLRPSTIRGYREKLRNHILPYFQASRIKLTDLKVFHLETFYRFLKNEKGLSDTTIRHCHRLLSKALNDAIRYDYIVTNPAAKVELPKQIKYEAKFLNSTQIKELFVLFEGDVLEPIIRFIGFYGVRRSEALGLCWDMVDFEKNQFTIARTMVQADGENYLQDCTKNASSRRTMPLSDEMKKLLINLKKCRTQYALLFPETYASNNLVFVWEDGSPITPNYLSSHFHKIISNSDLPPIRLHDLRHSAATNLISMGLSLVETQQWLGHSLPSTTLNFYSHADATFKHRACEMMEQALSLDDRDK